MIPSTIIIPPDSMARNIPELTALETDFKSFWPYNWAIITVAPEESPVIKLIKSAIEVEVDPPTAARAILPQALPTTIASRVLYNC